MKFLLKEFIYKLLDTVTFRKGMKISVNGFALRMPLRYYRYYYDGYEQENFEFYKQAIKPGDHVIDIGGHIGLHAVVFSKLAFNGKVYVFEPAPNSYAIIKNTIKINKLEDRILLFKEAVSDKKGNTVFYINDSPLADNANSLVQYRTDKKLLKVDVPLISIDEFIAEKNIPKIDFIKIDAEGAELDVLKGAVKCLADLKPKMTLGLHPSAIKEKGDSLAEIFDILHKHNYSVKLHDKEMDKEAFCEQTDLFDVQLS
jgi:FkbM family methyltransferase